MSGREQSSVTHGIFEYPSSLGFAPTVAWIEAAIVRAGLTIFARIDHATGARDAGLAMPPTVVLTYGHARGGTPIMLASPRAALDLPLRVLVREDGAGRVFVAFHPIADVLRAAGVPGDLVTSLDRAQAILAVGPQP